MKLLKKILKEKKEALAVKKIKSELEKWFDQVTASGLRAVPVVENGAIAYYIALA